MDKIVEIFHEILNLLPFRTEAHAQELRAKVTDLTASDNTDGGGSETGGNDVAGTDPVGRNLTAPGVVTGNVPNDTPED